MHLRVLFVPGLILVLTVAYWLHISEAPSAARRVPLGVIAIVVFFAVLTIISDIKEAKETSSVSTVSEDERNNTLAKALKKWQIQILFVILSIFYFLGFSYIGFNLSNLIFLIFTLPLAGANRTYGWIKGTLRNLGIALLISLVLWFLAHIMDFKIPVSALGI